MNPKILKLSESVINQIAAGEVVENPSSIVKELIENSLDAGAKRISIQIVGGGEQLIRVEDDGCGMSPEEAPLSLERHATSKIQSVDDLQTLATMGFRGEAMAAMAAVSHLKIETSNGTGTRILTEGGRILSIEPCARNRGTTIEIRSLFYNVPARKKFQKSPSANAAQVTRIVENIAIAHPEIAFSLNGREWAPTDFKSRIEEILGEHEHTVKNGAVFGFIGEPLKASATRTGQYLYINQRPIFSPLIAKAVKEGYGTRIGEHAYPRFVLFLNLPPSEVDFNVHPQKKEVRFHNEGALFRAVHKAVEETFAPPIIFPEPISFTMSPAFSLAESYAPPPAEIRFEPQSLDLVFPEKPLAVIGSYLLVLQERLILVDLKAAHARLLFDALHQEKKVSQPLIWPLEIPLERGDEEKIGALNQLGVECRALKRTLLVEALPPFLEAPDFPRFLADWREGKQIGQIATHFCRSAQTQFSIDQATALWRQVQKCKDSLYDPLGNPISATLGEEELTKWMKNG
ncbi:MAG: DNA mismatch repair endonuclease MutL [Chlamydiales bacterium]